VGKKEISMSYEKKSNLFILIQETNSGKIYEIQIPKVDSSRKNITQTQTISLLTDFYLHIHPHFW
jgi:hypothetical protein